MPRGCSLCFVSQGCSSRAMVLLPALCTTGLLRALCILGLLPACYGAAPCVHCSAAPCVLHHGVAPCIVHLLRAAHCVVHHGVTPCFVHLKRAAPCLPRSCSRQHACRGGLHQFRGHKAAAEDRFPMILNQSRVARCDVPALPPGPPSPPAARLWGRGNAGRGLCCSRHGF